MIGISLWHLVDSFIPENAKDIADRKAIAQILADCVNSQLAIWDTYETKYKKEVQ